ncbi:MAG: glycosyltransferase family 4 protein [Fibrobacter sp.]|nr:glycosyltransferase family 4 protein [Fibrobacter sp.]
MKDVVIIANFVAGLQGRDNNRFSYLATLLSRECKVELVASNFNHGEKKKRDSVADYPFKVTLLDEPGYSKNVCFKRFWSHYVWGRNVISYLKKRKKPDVIYCAVPSLTAPARVSDYCKKEKIRFIIDIQDLWPEAFMMVFDVPFMKKVFFSPFTYLANKIYRNADEIVAVSKTYVSRAVNVNKTVNATHTVFLGTNLDVFDDFARKNKKEFDSSEIKLAYCGTLGSSYDLTSVFAAMRKLESVGVTNIRFIVMGDGPRKKEFIASAQGLKVDFLGRLPYDQMCGILNSCDISVNPIRSKAAQSIINKHADYAAAGIPVINTQECIEYREMIKSYNMGFNCKNEDSDDMAEKIKILVENDEMRKKMGANSRLCAEKWFDRKKTYCELVDLIIDE